MFCINCGDKINDGETICKGCGKLSANIRDELLAMSEKRADLKCENCGEDIIPGQHYCSKCGAPVKKS